jgi:hypothetical protein
MARTRQSARKSTGGVAPRRDLKSKAKPKTSQTIKKSGPSKVPQKLLSVRTTSRPRITPVASDDEMEVSEPDSPAEPSRMDDEPVLDKKGDEPDVRLAFLDLILLPEY